MKNFPHGRTYRIKYCAISGANAIETSECEIGVYLSAISLWQRMMVRNKRAATDFRCDEDEDVLQVANRE